MDEGVRLRPAQVEDAPAIAQVRIDSWRATYRGLISDQYLDAMSLEYYTQSWTSILSAGSSQGYTYVAENAQGQIVGFAFGGPERTWSRDYQGEIYAIYLLPDYQRQGIGRRLVAAVVRHMIEEGMQSMLIWVLATNSAVQFYQSLGGEPVRENEVQFGDQLYRQVAYGFADIRPLALPDETPD
jgi:ribosomal protein S18 acetylase RimI-like enzyme